MPINASIRKVPRYVRNSRAKNDKLGNEWALSIRAHTSSKRQIRRSILYNSIFYHTNTDLTERTKKISDSFLFHSKQPPIPSEDKKSKEKGRDLTKSYNTSPYIDKKKKIQKKKPTWQNPNEKKKYFTLLQKTLQQKTLLHKKYFFYKKMSQLKFLLSCLAFENWQSVLFWYLLMC